jgi:dTMP kinase
VNRRGKFITFEGVEGSGKTTQARLFCETLRKQGLEVVETREPGGTALGEEIRKLLLAHSDSSPTAIAELLLFLAARSQLVGEVVIPAVEAGKWVVCDRFSDSTLAYQGYGRGLDIDATRRMNEIATGGCTPDLTVVLDLDVETGIRRAIEKKGEFSEVAGGDRMEKEAREFHDRVRNGYLDLARQEPDRIKVIPATGSIEEVQRAVNSLLEPFLVMTK